MRLLRLYQLMGLVTAVSLVYIHMQMQIIDLAYRGKSKEKQIKKLIEKNGNTTYQVLSLKSANSIGVKLLAENSSMDFAEPKNIIEVQVSADQLTKKSSNDLSSVKTNTNPLLSLLSFGSRAEARMQK
ncbi:hypothetical protein MNBD_BACTEROID05-861 [hydrothermal vent metagenome]|uniref:Uncharacterized protein n=1 Tax=hydrothermal vent metagenome TaxID=652676 RepID=A0A3B0U198_9ZZZZ